MTGPLDLSQFLFGFNLEVLAFVQQYNNKNKGDKQKREIILFFNLDLGIKYSQ